MAPQILSSSVADAIAFLCFGMQMEEFQDSYGTVKFNHKVNMVLNMLNSRNPCDKGAKTQLTAQNLATWQNDAESLTKFIFELRDSHGRLLHNSHHKTPIWGFTITLHSIAKYMSAPVGASISSIWAYCDKQIFNGSFGTSVQQNMVQMWLEQQSRCTAIPVSFMHNLTLQQD